MPQPNDAFNCRHLGASPNDEQDILNFTVRDEKGLGLLRYIRYQAFPDEDAGTMRTYIVRDNVTAEMVCFFSLKAGLVSLNERDIEVVDVQTGEVKHRRVFDTYPGIELANFAVNQTFIRRHPELKGVGFIIFRLYIMPIVQRAAEDIGVKALYLYALPYEELVARYQHYGFARLEEQYEKEIHRRLKPKYDDSCIFMYRML